MVFDKKKKNMNTDEVFTMEYVSQLPVAYKPKDADGEPVQATFNTVELQK